MTGIINTQVAIRSRCVLHKEETRAAEYVYRLDKDQCLMYSVKATVVVEKIFNRWRKINKVDIKAAKDNLRKLI